MKRIGIFQFYSEFGFVEEYIEELLRSMKSILSRLIIVYNCELCDSELCKLNRYTEFVYKRTNLGYDAGAYKDILLNLYQDDWSCWDELVLFNCTFYGPLFSWEKVFKRMEEESIDFWGLSRHYGKIKLRKNGSVIPEHLQSYFLVIRNNMFCSSSWWEYWNELEYPDNYFDAIEKFELRFTPFFKEKGFRYTSWVDVQGYSWNFVVNPCITSAYELIKDYQFPIIKYKVMSIDNFEGMKKVVEFVDRNLDYDVDLIKNHIKHLSEKNKWRPFSVETLEEFVGRHKHIYIFGHGKYGVGLGQFFKYKHWKFDAYVVSMPQDSNEIAFSDLYMEEQDGLIVALGKNLLDEMKEKLRANFNETQILFPNIIE